MSIGKRLKKAREGVDREKLYPLDEAIKMVKERAKSKFDETIEIAINLGVDPRHADQMVRGVVNLPNGTGRDRKSTRLNSSHPSISYAVFCLKKKRDARQ